jgi:rubredoxin
MAKTMDEREDASAGTHEHTRVEVVSSCPDCGQESARKTFGRRDLEGVGAERATALPDREAMSLVNANVAAPINAALALNVLSDGSIAIANATQYAPIDQST